MVTSSPANGWAVAQVAPGVRLRCLSTPAPGVVWAAGADGTAVRTNDGGRTWHDVGPGGTSDLRAVHAFDQHTALLLSFGDQGQVLRTSDGGRRWTTVYRPPDGRFFLDFLCLDGRGHGIAVSDPVDNAFRLAGTTDAGVTWTDLDPHLLPPALPGETTFAASGCAVFERAGDFAFVTGGADRARVFGSRGRGRSWSVSMTPFPAHKDAGLFSLGLDDCGRAVAVGGDYHDQNHIWAPVVAAESGAPTWSPARSQLGYRSAVVWTGQVWLCVGGGTADVALDDGREWAESTTPTPFDTLARAPDDLVWAAGPDGFVGCLSHSAAMPGQPRHGLLASK